MIPQSFIQELLSRVDVVEVVGRHVQLKKAGANYLGLCPFHGEKSPSFTVTPTKQFYHCFGCGVHGSAITFLMEHLGMTFPEAVADLAHGVGLQVPQETGPQAGAPRRDPDLLELMSRVAQFYKMRLKDSARAIAYLKQRGLTGETAARYGIGYAPDQWRGLEAAVADYDAPEMETAGLVIDSPGDDGRRKRYDRFRDRVMFPIRNPRGQVIGFGGRVLDKGEPKYMNSPETPLFSKGHELYGLYEARAALRQTDCVVVVEGYMDVVMLAQHGVGNAVATLGTATTVDHVRKLLRQVDRVVFAFDGDAAGRKAAWRALEACLPMAADTKRLDFLFLPPEHDPDSYVREQGADGFARLLDTAMPLSEFLVRELSARVDLERPEGRARLQADARPLLLQLPMAALRIQLVHRVAEQARISTAEMQAYLDAGDQGAGRGGAPRRASDPRAGGRAGGSELDRGGDPTADRDDADPGGWHIEPASDRWHDDDPGSGYGQPGGQGYGHRAPGGAGQGRRDGQRFRGQNERGQGGWRRDRDNSPAGIWPGRGALRGAARPPELLRRLRWLSAHYPALAHGEFSTDHLPGELCGWLDALRELAPTVSVAAVCESLRGRFPQDVAQLEGDAADGRMGVSDMAPEEALREFDGALTQLRDRGLRQLIDALIGKGIHDESDRNALKSLQAQLYALRGRN